MDYIKYLKEGSFNSLVYRYYEPDTNAKRPLLVLLHGHGERGNDNIANLNNFDILLNNIFIKDIKPYILCPQCPDDCLWSPLATYNIEDRTYDLEKENPSHAMSDLIILLDKFIKEHENIDRNNIILLGLSMGGAAVLELALRSKNQINKLVAICPASIPMKQLNEFVGKKVYLFHGLNDNVVDVKFTKLFFTKLSKINEHTYVRYFANTPHNCWDDTFKVIDLDNLYSI